MGPKPGFTQASLSGKTVRVVGHTDPGDLADIVEIRVTLAQGDTVARATVDSGFGGTWSVELSGDFRLGPATAFGAETRKENFATITWVNPLEII